MNQEKRKHTQILLAVIIAIIIIGIVAGWLYSQIPANNPQDSKQGCESVGGDWNNTANRCLLSYKEAGESCIDGGQCVSGICSPPALTEKQQSTLLHEPLTDIVGTCSANNEPFGCMPQVIKGSVSMESMCWRESR